MNQLRIELYWDKQRNYRWRMKRCGRIIAESGEGYKRSKMMVRTLQRLMMCIAGGNFILRDYTK